MIISIISSISVLFVFGVAHSIQTSRRLRWVCARSRTCTLGATCIVFETKRPSVRSSGITEQVVNACVPLPHLLPLSKMCVCVSLSLSLSLRCSSTLKLHDEKTQCCLGPIPWHLRGAVVGRPTDQLFQGHLLPRAVADLHGCKDYNPEALYCMTLRQPISSHLRSSRLRSYQVISSHVTLCHLVSWHVLQRSHYVALLRCLVPSCVAALWLSMRVLSLMLCTWTRRCRHA